MLQLQKEASLAIRQSTKSSQPDIGRIYYQDVESGVMEEAESTLSVLRDAQSQNAFQVLAELNKIKGAEERGPLQRRVHACAKESLHGSEGSRLADRGQRRGAPGQAGREGEGTERALSRHDVCAVRSVGADPGGSDDEADDIDAVSDTGAVSAVYYGGTGRDRDRQDGEWEDTGVSVADAASYWRSAGSRRGGKWTGGAGSGSGEGVGGADS